MVNGMDLVQNTNDVGDTSNDENGTLDTNNNTNTTDTNADSSLDEIMDGEPNNQTTEDNDEFTPVNFNDDVDNIQN